MLATLAEFPHPGSIAWTRDEGDRVRILENDGSRDPLIAYTGLPPRDPALRRIGAASMPASGNTRLPLSKLAATRDEALLPPPVAKPNRSSSRAKSVNSAQRATRRSAR